MAAEKLEMPESVRVPTTKCLDDERLEGDALGATVFVLRISMAAAGVSAAHSITFL